MPLPQLLQKAAASAAVALPAAASAEVEEGPGKGDLDTLSVIEVRRRILVS